MCGNGVGLSGKGVTRTTKTTMMCKALTAGCCAGAPSTYNRGSSAARYRNYNSIRAIVTGTTGFGWWCPHQPNGVRLYLWTLSLWCLNL